MDRIVLETRYPEGRLDLIAHVGVGRDGGLILSHTPTRQDLLQDMSVR